MLLDTYHVMLASVDPQMHRTLARRETYHAEFRDTERALRGYYSDDGTDVDIRTGEGDN